MFIRVRFRIPLFDLIYSFGVIHHIENRSLLYSEIIRMLKSGGRVIFVTITYYSLLLHYLFTYSILNRTFFKKFGRSKIHSTIDRRRPNSFFAFVDLRHQIFRIDDFNISWFRCDQLFYPSNIFPPFQVFKYTS